MTPTTARKRTRPNLNPVSYLVLGLGCILFLIPVIFVVLTSLKSLKDLNTLPFFQLPGTLHFENFSKAWVNGRLGTYFGNSALICAIKVPLGILIEALAAFALTKMSFKWSNPVFAIFLVGMMVPGQASLIPLNIMLNASHLSNTYVGLIVIYIAFGLPFGILVLWGFFRTIPNEIDGAAKVDGCSDTQRFFRVILPLAKPAMAALVIIDFLATWNEFLLAQIFISKDSMKTITNGLMSFVGQHFTDFTQLNAGVLLTMIPPLIIYLVFQKHFVSGIAGAIKG
jgi:raffinose/stachyose/melibiose transport system permease protein